MHRALIEKYFSRVAFRYGDLEDDGYILTHLGYHMFKAGLDAAFPEVYLDLNYVEAVLKACGPACLLNDYRKYGHLIGGRDGEHEDALADFEEFCRTVGVTVSSSAVTDIVQLGLGEPASSAVYLAARRLANQRPEFLYLEWRNRSNIHSQNIATILHPGVPTAIRFLPDSRVVTSSQEGVIKVWNVTNGEVVQRLHGHRGPITCLGLDASAEEDGGAVGLCSGSEDGTVRLWRTEPCTEVGGPDAASLVYRKKSLRRPSPRLSKLTALHELFTSRGQQDDSLRCLKYLGGKAEEEGDVDSEVLSVSWRPAGGAAGALEGHIAVAGRAGRIIVFDAGSGAQLWEAAGHAEPVNCVEYSAVGDQLASGSDDCTVRLWAAHNGDFLGEFQMSHSHVLKLKLNFCSCIRRF
jgi:WD40 repeat protein